VLKWERLNADDKVDVVRSRLVRARMPPTGGSMSEQNRYLVDVWAAS